MFTAGQASRFPAGTNDDTFTVNIHNATGVLTTQTREDFRCPSCAVGFVERLICYSTLEQRTRVDGTPARNASVHASVRMG